MPIHKKIDAWEEIFESCDLTECLNKSEGYEVLKLMSRSRQLVGAFYKKGAAVQFVEKDKEHKSVWVFVNDDGQMEVIVPKCTARLN